MDPILTEIAQAEARGEAVCLCIVVETGGAVPRHAGSKMLVFADGSIKGSVGGGSVESKTITYALAAMKNQKPVLLHFDLDAEAEGSVGLCGGQVTVYVEPQVSRPKLIIIGAGHVGRAVGRAASLLNFQIVVSDDRVKLCTQEEFPEAESFLPVAMEEIPDHIVIDSNTYVVAVSRGSEVDIAGLPRLIACKPRYLGVIGSKRRWQATKDGLLARGLSEADLAEIHTPIGLKIGAETPDEIAVSIMAEIIQIKNQK